MVVIRARFDGQQVIVPPEAHGLPPGEVILVFENGSQLTSETEAWMAAAEPAFKKVWDNSEDAVYHSL